MTTAEDLRQKLDRIKRILLSEAIPGEVLEAVGAELDAVEERLETNSGESYSVLELRGLGKEIWQGIDVDEYIREERASWR